jgi:hypothetical protein
MHTGVAAGVRPAFAERPMWNRSLVNLLAASVLCLGLGNLAQPPLQTPDDSGPNPAFSIGGKVAGSTGPITLQNSNGTNLTVATDGSFTFETPMVSSAIYNVTVAVPPSFQTCRVANAAGTVELDNISDITVTCTPNTYTAGNTVAARDQGLSASDFP